MSSSYSLFKTHIAASGIEHSTTGNFTSPTSINLIVAKNNVIEIFELPQKSASNKDTKLLSIARYSLFGEIQCIKCARFVPNHTDSLLISFPDAKLSVIEFDASKHDIVTKALFNFDPMQHRIGNTTSCHDGKIRVDALDRCAAYLLSQDLIFILPLFVAYLEHHNDKKHSHPINIPFADTLSNETQQEIEDEERRSNPNSHSQRTANTSLYISPLPPPTNVMNENSEEQIDQNYLHSMQNGNKEWNESEWDIDYQKSTKYDYKSLCCFDYFVINLRAKCEKIVDFIFLDGYNTPQMLLLFEKMPTWGGRIPVRNKTISLCSLTLNVVHRQFNIPFILDNILPHDFSSLHAIPSASNMLDSAVILEQNGNRRSNKNHQKYDNESNYGGALIIGSNAILHFGTFIDFGLTFNEHSDGLQSDFVGLCQWNERVLNLEHCVISQPLMLGADKNECDFLMADGDGFVYLLSIELGQMNMCTIGNGPIPSTMCNLFNESAHFLFVGSRLGDSLLISLQHRTKQKKNEQNVEKNDALHAEFFGDASNENEQNEKNTNRKRTFSQMNVSENDNEQNENMNDDLAMDLFGITTESLAEAAQKTGSEKKKISKKQSKEQIFGPKIKRRKLSKNCEIQMRDMHFFQVIDFANDKLFENEIKREEEARPNMTECENVSMDGSKIKMQRERAQILREKYEFQIHDVLSSLCPITSSVMGKSNDLRFLHQDYMNLYASTGFGTHGKLSIIMEGIRPQILAKTNNKKICNAVGCWTLYGTQNNQREYHRYFVASDLSKTQIFSVENELKLLSDNGSDFRGDLRTICCGHIGVNKQYTIQIHEKGVCVLYGLKLVYEYALNECVGDREKMEVEEEALSVIDGYIEDCYVLLHLCDKSIRLLTFDEDKSTKFEAFVPNLPQFKHVNDEEIERRKREFVHRRCNKMTWNQYIEFEECVNVFLNDANNDQNIYSLIQFIDDTLVNPPKNVPNSENDENMEEEKIENEVQNNSMKEEISDSDENVQIELADHLKPAIVENTAATGTGWQGTDWTNFDKESEKTLFDLGINTDILLKRLYGKYLFNDSFDTMTTNQMLHKMVTRDLDIGHIEKIHLFSFGAENCIKTLSELNEEWLRKNERLSKENASSYQQCLSRIFQTKRIEMKLAAKKNEKVSMRQMMFGEVEQNNDKQCEDESNQKSENEMEENMHCFVVIARSFGTMQIYKLPNFVLVFECNEVHIGHDLLINNLIHDETLQIILSKHQITKRKGLKDYIAQERNERMEANKMYFDDELIPNMIKDELWCPRSNDFDDESFDECEERKVEEIGVCTFEQNVFLVFVLSNGDFIIYEMFKYYEGANALLSKIGRNMSKNEHLQILPVRFKRFAHSQFCRKKFTEFSMQNAKIDKIKKKLHCFNDFNGFYGILICGVCPSMILSHRGRPIVHNLSLKDDIRGFAVFNHCKMSKVAQDRQIKNGCIYFSEYGLVIGTIPKTVRNIGSNVEKMNDENEENENENDPSSERFGHSFVCMKKRINAQSQFVDIDYDNFEYPIAHIPLSETLHFIIFDAQSGTYLLITSRYKYVAGTEMTDKRDIRACESYFECQLFNPFKCQIDDVLGGFTIHQSTDIEDGGNGDDLDSIPISEHILCAKYVQIEECQRIGANNKIKKNVIVLGTGTNQGEDSASIGRIVLLEIIASKNYEKNEEKNAKFNFYKDAKTKSDLMFAANLREISIEDDNVQNVYANASKCDQKYFKKEVEYHTRCRQQDFESNINYKIHFVFARRERTAVSAVNAVNGLIVAAIGPKLLLFRWDGTQLIGTAFLDTRIHCLRILVLQNFVLTADLFQGLDLYHWQSDIVSIVKLARDVHYRSIYSVNLYIHKIENNQNMNDEINNDQNGQRNKMIFEFLVSDMNQNLNLVSFEPHLPFNFLSKMDKEKLYTRCLFHIGSNISNSQLLKLRNETFSNFFCLNVCTDGSINYLVPISEQIYRRLSSLHSQMIFYCEHAAGLNPREYRYSQNNFAVPRDRVRHSHVMHNHSALNAVHGMDRSPTLTSKNIIDYDLIRKFINLDARTQNKLTANIGVRNANVIINHLAKISNQTKWF